MECTVQRWPHEVIHYSVDEVRKYCVQDEAWQIFRVRLKGMPTERKLDNLEIWRSNSLTFNNDFRKTEVQLSNYINALKRGGQLDMECRIQR